MTTRRRKYRHRDRVRTPDGRTGTVVDAHQNGNLGILHDTGPKTVTVHYPQEVEILPPRPGCTRCGATSHHAFTCPGGNTG